MIQSTIYVPVKGGTDNLRTHFKRSKLSHYTGTIMEDMVTEEVPKSAKSPVILKTAMEWANKHEGKRMGYEANGSLTQEPVTIDFNGKAIAHAVTLILTPVKKKSIRTR